MYNQVLVSYTDQNGKQCTLFFTAQDQGAGGAAGYAALAAAVQNCTDAAINAVQFQATLLLDATAGDGPYNTIYDRAAMLLKIPATGQPITYELAAPKASLFLPDTVTLDLMNSDLIALQSEMSAFVGDKLGNPIGPIRRGYRTQARMPS